jgi:hypothetical protein
LFGRKVVVFGFVEVPDFGPASCGVFCHVKSIANPARMSRADYYSS